MTVKPIFVSGIGRSGTSAVLASLAEHKSMHNYPRVGEAPFITSFLNFLVDYEDKSPNAEYNKKNYRLSDSERGNAMADFMVLNQCGRKLEEESEKKFWITKTSLLETSFEKAEEVFGEVRCVYIMRNGIEVINSARKFVGFKNLTFTEHCKRWMDNIEYCRYLHGRPLCAIVEHGKLVKDPVATYRKIFEEIGLEDDPAPANWIASNLFNSSFDETSKGIATSKVFDNRTMEAWNEWSDEERAEFIETCDPIMQEFGFLRPYAEVAEQEKTVAVVDARDSEVAELEETVAVVNTRSAEETFVKRVCPQFLELCGSRILPSEFNYLCNISNKYNYMFVNNPKVASTSLLKELQTFENVRVAEKMLNPHQRNKSPLRTMASISHDDQIDLLNSEELYRFAFVRDPFSRLLSAYLSKITIPFKTFKFDRSKANHNPPKAKIITLLTGKEVDENTDMTVDIDFASFIKAICSQDPADMDLHWKPQFDLLQPDKIEYDFIGRFERFNEDFSAIKAKLGINAEAEPQYSSNRTRAYEKLNAYYTEELQNLVRDKYKVDFENFGYSDTISIPESEAA